MMGKFINLLKGFQEMRKKLGFVSKNLIPLSPNGLDGLEMH